MDLQTPFFENCQTLAKIFDLHAGAATFMFTLHGSYGIQHPVGLFYAA